MNRCGVVIISATCQPTTGGDFGMQNIVTRQHSSAFEHPSLRAMGWTVLQQYSTIYAFSMIQLQFVRLRLLKHMLFSKAAPEQACCCSTGVTPHSFETVNLVQPLFSRIEKQQPSKLFRPRHRVLPWPKWKKNCGISFRSTRSTATLSTSPHCRYDDALGVVPHAQTPKE